jgi:hypothetical protein
MFQKRALFAQAQTIPINATKNPVQNPAGY